MEGDKCNLLSNFTFMK